ncbi:MAG: hypothetical protein HC795_02450 [Coleofasciculaceae cyanobacterium RL_1_1]|nr:hypothetical protein [Coleofasciculaceae cyanobacterium RL_1_1]
MTAPRPLLLTCDATLGDGLQRLVVFSCDFGNIHVSTHTLARTLGLWIVRVAVILGESSRLGLLLAIARGHEIMTFVRDRRDRRLSGLPISRNLTIASRPRPFTILVTPPVFPCHDRISRPVSPQADRFWY